ncbi:MAG: hypothetical protein ABI613_05610 [Gemmatimonadota bacterium]
MTILPFRYGRWMLRDILLAQGALLLGVAILSAFILRRFDTPPALGVVVSGIAGQLGSLFILFCTAGMVSSDRIQGYYRSYFARPVSPAGFYLQRWVLGGLMVALVVPVLTVALSVVLGGFRIDWHLMAQLEMLYLLLGGSVFFLSTMIRADWLFALLALIVDTVLSQLKSSGVKLSLILNAIATVLPPFHLVKLPGANPSGSALMHVLLYGAGLVLAALAVLRWRPLGTGGRS